MNFLKNIGRLKMTMVILNAVSWCFTDTSCEVEASHNGLIFKADDSLFLVCMDHIPSIRLLSMIAVPTLLLLV